MKVTSSTILTLAFASFFLIGCYPIHHVVITKDAAKLVSSQRAAIISTDSYTWVGEVDGERVKPYGTPGDTVWVTPGQHRILIHVSWTHSTLNYYRHDSKYLTVNVQAGHRYNLIGNVSGFGETWRPELVDAP